MSFWSHIPVVGALETVVHQVAGNDELARRAARNTASSNSHTPLVGHLQGFVASAAGDDELARRSYRNATHNMIPPGLPGKHLAGGGYNHQEEIFPNSNASDVAKLSAFCASDVYNVRTRGGRRHEGVRLGSKTYTVQCWTGAHPELEFADYVIGDLIVLAFRGTSDCATDWIKDVHVAIGTFSAIEHLVSNAPSPAELRRRHGLSRVTVTGHSLGGAAALVYANKHMQAIESCNCFNPGNAAAGFSLQTSPRIVCHCVEGDLVSLGGGALPSNTRVYCPVKGVGGFPNHGMQHFTYSDDWDRMIDKA